MPRIAYFDCLSGISGDMTLGALVDLGAASESIESAIRSMGLPDLTIRTEEVKKCGFRAVSIHIEHPPEHAHRHLHQITEMIDRADQIDETAKQTARDIFQQVAVAEARVHGTTIEKVHFHEVGAIDSIADIVGAAVAMHQLNIESVVASPVPTGTGSIKIAHGTVSVPAPATAEILRGIPIAPSTIPTELTTPTGAAILAACASEFGPVPAMTIDAVGYGAGARDLDGQANVLRIMLGHTSDSLVGMESDTVVVLETNIDDSTPEQLAHCVDHLLTAGALDAFQTATMMKKGRMGTQITVIARPEDMADLESILFQHSSSIGIRRHTASRHKLPRRAVTVHTSFGEVRAKLLTMPDGSERLSVEDDDARSLADRARQPTTEIRQAAVAAWKARAT